MKKEIPYIRVGTTYYKLIDRPLISGEKTRDIARWLKETIRSDHNLEYLESIPKFDGFCCIPDNLNFKQSIDNFYNMYMEIPHPPSTPPVSKEMIPFSLIFMGHIFGEQLDLGLDYIKVLLEQPVQILPILCLVSKERSTGKSTFIKWLKEIFGLNMTYIKGDSFNSQFNSDWASKEIVAIDEVLFDRKEMTERLKYLSTTNKDKLENKGKDREEIDFFAKFILCSNNEDNFIQIDENEIRFWIIKVRPIKSEITDFLDNLIKEIPHFLKFLIDREFYSQKKTRMWFSPEEIRTKALQQLVFRNNNKLEMKIIELLFEFFDTNDDLEIQAVPQDILNMLQRMFGVKYFSRNDVRNVLKDQWKLVAQNNSMSYIRYDLDYSGTFYQNNSKGRYFTISKSFIIQKYDDMMI